MAWLPRFRRLPRLFGLARDIRATRLALETIAAELTLFNRAQGIYPATTDNTAEIEVEFANPERIQAMEQTEQDLMRATGRPPSEAEMLEELERRGIH